MPNSTQSGTDTLLYESSKSKIYHRWDTVLEQNVVLKILNYEFPTPADIERFHNEYDILANVRAKGIRKVLRRTKEKNRHALILEWIEGKNIREIFVNNGSMPESERISAILRVAVSLSQALSNIHQHNIIHKDISAFNIIVDSNHTDVQLIDFGLATTIHLKHAYSGSPTRLEGTLHYISPEQTGRMNRVVDYRSDLYSMGVVLFEVLTGRLPFSGNEAMELIHAHIAQIPPLAHTINSAIPEQLSRVVAKLLAKNAEDRYQSALGVKTDLERCLEEYTHTGAITLFPLATNDFSGKFTLSQRLYGREEETTRLLRMFEDCSEGALALALVAGYSGTGKSVLVSELHKPITERRGYYVSGKFDQFQRAVPYYAVVEAFKELINILLSEPEDRLRDIRTRLQEAVGEEGQVLTNVLPNLEVIIGKQPDIPELGGSESQNRFTYVFRKFVQALCVKEHPIVLFIDDMQWADFASLQLLRTMMTNVDCQYLLCICAYRDNEVSPAHPFMTTVNDLKNAGCRIETVSVGNLSKENVHELLRDAMTVTITTANASPLAKKDADILALTDLVYEKTQGNAFFVTQFLRSLGEERLLWFDSENMAWQWDIAKIRSRNITDNVVEFMAEKVKRLPDQTQATLRRAACLGSSFRLDMLMLASPHDEIADDVFAFTTSRLAALESHVRQTLNEALKEGLVLPLSDNAFKFAHDRIQQAVYSLIKEEDKALLHLSIGRALYDGIPQEEREQHLFDMVNQFNGGIERIDGERERRQVAVLNWQASTKARTNSAFQTALEYAEMGLRLMPENAWQREYELALGLHTEAVEACYLNADFTKMEPLFHAIVGNAKTILDTVKPYEIRINAFKAQNKFKDAILTGLEVLEQLGESFPKKPTQLHALPEFAKMALALRGTTKESILALPVMTDPSKIAAMRIIADIASSVYWGMPDLLLLIVFRMVSLSLKYGNNPVSCYAYGAYGVILCGVVGAMKKGLDYGDIALSLLDKLDAKEWKAQIYVTPYGLIRPWNEHVKLTLRPLQESFQIGMETGAIEYACVNTNIYCIHAFLCGKPLVRLEEETRAYSESYKKLKQDTNVQYNEVYRQAMLNFLGRSDNPLLLTGSAYNEEEMLRQNSERNDKSGLFFIHFHKLMLGMYFREFAQAQHHATEARKLLDAVLAKYEIPNHHFYEALSLLALCGEESATLSAKEKQKHLKRAEKNRNKLKTWSKDAPENFLHKYYLVEAELLRVTGKRNEARAFYDKAINAAGEQEFLHEAALGNELAGRFYAEESASVVSEHYLKSAYNLYREWGATAKLRDMEKRYNISLSRQNTTGGSLERTMDSSLSVSSAVSHSVLDIQTLLKASTSISREVVLPKLLTVLMQLVVENAGAQRGLMLLMENNDLFIQAEHHAATNDITLLKRIPAQGSGMLAETIMQFVARTSTSVVLHNAQESKQFGSDDHIKRQNVQSVLCLPIVNQGKILGLLYLENNNIAGAFTEDRINLLSLLSGQIAVSISNALLYDQLEQKVAERTNELAQEKKNIEFANSELSSKNSLLEQTMTELQQAQSHLVHSEKMASLGVLTAGIAHEINNPVNFVSGSVQPLRRNVMAMLKSLEEYSAITPESLTPESLDAIREQLQNIAENKKKARLDKMIGQTDALLLAINDGTQRIAEIVHSLRSFSRLDENALKYVALTECFDSTLTILHSQYDGRMRIVKDYGEVAEIECYAGQINQVLMNIVSNAIQAIPADNADGEIRLTTRQEGEKAIIRIKDNGPGMPDAVKTKIFDPFFTTKDVGSGTGLGLSIASNIIDKHHGSITVESELGKGSEFIITLPIHQRKV